MINQMIENSETEDRDKEEDFNQLDEFKSNQQ